MNILVTEEITNATVNRILQEILKNKDDSEITIYLNSQGGDIESSYVIYDMLKLSGKKIITYAINEIFSCAVVIYLVGEERLATNHSKFMIHAPYDEYEKDDIVDEHKYQKRLEEIKKVKSDYFKMISEHTSLSPKKIQKYINAAKDGDWYLNTSDAIKFGLVTKIGFPI